MPTCYCAVCSMQYAVCTLPHHCFKSTDSLVPSDRCCVPIFTHTWWRLNCNQSVLKQCHGCSSFYFHHYIMLNWVALTHIGLHSCTLHHMVNGHVHHIEFAWQTSIDWVVSQLTAALHNSSPLANRLFGWQTQISALGFSHRILTCSSNTYRYVLPILQTHYDNTVHHLPIGCSDEKRKCLTLQRSPRFSHCIFPCSTNTFIEI